MYINFTFEDGGNPYITTTNKTLWNMVKKYYMEQTGEKSFHVLGRCEVWTAGKRLTPYKKEKNILRDFAIDWQYKYADLRYSWGDLYDWQQFFSEYGKKYGLLREFRENAIC